GSTRTTSKAPPSPVWGGSSSGVPDGRSEVRRPSPAQAHENGVGLAATAPADSATEAAMSGAGRRLCDRAGVVTGGARGIGRAGALACGREGAAVLVNGRDEDAGRSVLAELAALGARATWHAADLGRVGEARGLIRAALEAFGHLDVLVNNAGVFQR